MIRNIAIGFGAAAVIAFLTAVTFSIPYTVSIILALIDSILMMVYTWNANIDYKHFHRSTGWAGFFLILLVIVNF